MSHVPCAMIEQPKQRMKTFRDLEIWQKAIEIADRIYRLTATLPDGERYGLISQMRRAAVSLSSNIAEGFRRRNNREFRQFLHTSLGSAAELESHIELCRRLHVIDGAETQDLLKSLDHFQAMTMSLIKTLRC